MEIDFSNFRINTVKNFNQVVEITDFSCMSDVDLMDWNDLRNSIIGLMSIEPSIFNKIDIVDIPEIDEIV